MAGRHTGGKYRSYTLWSTEIAAVAPCKCSVVEMDAYVKKLPVASQNFPRVQHVGRVFSRLELGNPVGKAVVWHHMTGLQSMFSVAHTTGILSQILAVQLFHSPTQISPLLPFYMGHASMNHHGNGQIHQTGQ